MDSLIGQLEALTKQLPEDEVTAKRLYEVTRKLNLALEPQQMTIQRIMYTVSSLLWNGN